MKMFFKSVLHYVAIALTAMTALVCDALLRISYAVAEQLTPQKLEMELAQSLVRGISDKPKSVSIGSGSGDSPLSFVSMLKAVNGHTGCVNYA
jgi:hypothetical protein